ncbi:MAG: Holliday junction branch migration protein RuvA [Gammaproteobacteria bacterium]|nr:Holliday junction branch migration protein RuvA [Gammaproteobacteria bacterium]
MIARLSGKLILKQPPMLLIDVHGVGYEVEAPMSTFYELPEPGEDVTLLTHLTIRDDAHILFGFASEGERSLFRNLIKVNGVGPKMALTILSGIAAPDFVLCVQNRDAAALTRLPGIGKKTAERLVVEMQDRLGDSEGVICVAGHLSDIAANPARDAISALVALGYRQADADRMVKVVARDGMPSEEIIREALKAQVR